MGAGFISFDIRGIDELSIILRKFPSRIEKKILKSSLRKASKVIVKRARNTVPVRTGNLRRSIGIVVNKTNSKSAPSMSIGPRKGKKLKNDGWYGHLVEFGAPARGVAAQPFMRPAAEEGSAEFVKVFGESLGDGIDKIVREVRTR